MCGTGVDCVLNMNGGGTGRDGFCGNGGAVLVSLVIVVN